MIIYKDEWYAIVHPFSGILEIYKDLWAARKSDLLKSEDKRLIRMERIRIETFNGIDLIEREGLNG